MLEFLRRQSQSWLTWVAMGVITIVFVFFFGPQAGGLQQGSKSWAMRVDRTPVYDGQLESAIGRAQAFGQSFGEAERYEVKRQIAYDIALVTILGDEAADAGLAITDDELHCYIVNWNRGYRLDGDFICRQFPRTYTALYPNLDFNFYSDREGSFSSTYASDVRRWFGSSVENYEQFKRKELLALRYLELLSAGVPVTADEAITRWRARHDTVDLEVAVFDPAAEGLVEVSEEEIDTYLAENLDAVRAQYDAQLESYATERSVQLQRIYVRKPEGDAAIESTRARVEALFEEAKAADADFDALARENNEIEREAEVAGDMGVRETSTLSHEFVDALEGAADGDVVLVEQAYAWSITRLSADTPAGHTPFEEVQRDVAKAMITEAAQAELATTMAAQAEQLFAAAKAESDATLRDLLNDIEGSEIAIYHGTGPFGLEPVAPDTRGIDPQLLPYIRLTMRGVGEIPHVGVSPEMTRAVFALTEDAPLLDEIFEVDGKRVVARLKERVTADEPTGVELDMLTLELTRERADAIVGFGAAQRRILLHTGEPLPGLLEETLSQHNIRFQEKLFVPQRRGEDWE